MTKSGTVYNIKQKCTPAILGRFGDFHSMVKALRE
jgi:hypothetical protein